MLGRYDMARSALTTESGDLDDGSKVSAVDDLSPANADLAQGTSGNRPVIDSTTVRGLRLLTFDNADRLTVTPGASVKALVLLFFLPAGTSARQIVARDTGATTDKPALVVRLGS